MRRTLLLFLLLAAAPAHAEDSQTASASFPLLPDDAAAQLPRRSSPLDGLAPTSKAQLPSLPAPHAAPAPSAASSWVPTPRYAAPASGYAAPEPSPGARAPDAPWSPPKSPSFDGAPPRESDRDADPASDWLLSLEGVTHAPVDIGFQVGVEAPIGLRLFGGYGWMPAGYLAWSTGIAGNASGDAATKAVIENGFDAGRAWRVQAGLRPFRDLGLYLDAGYSRVSLEGSLSADEPGVGVAATGSYSVTTTLHMWLVELGYQAQIADRVVLGMGVGVMGVFGSETEIAASDAAVNDASLRTVEGEVDKALEDHGLVPTLTLRLGVDLI